jgi:hypothetical protein
MHIWINNEGKRKIPPLGEGNQPMKRMKSKEDPSGTA